MLDLGRVALVIERIFHIEGYASSGAASKNFIVVTIASIVISAIYFLSNTFFT